MKVKTIVLKVLFLFLAIGLFACEADSINDELQNTEEIEIQGADKDIVRPGSNNGREIQGVDREVQRPGSQG